MKDRFTEKEWKLFRGKKDEMLEELSRRINDKAIRILQNEDQPEYRRYLKLYEHIKQSDRLVGDCFNDWRRSTFHIFTAQLARQKLIPDEIWNDLSDATQEGINNTISI